MGQTFKVALVSACVLPAILAFQNCGPGFSLSGLSSEQKPDERERKVNVLASTAGDRVALQNAINAAIAVPGTTIVLEPRVYNLTCENTAGSFCLSMAGARDLKIQGTPGATQLRISTPLSGAILIDTSTGVTLSGFSIDYPNPPYSQALVMEVGADHHSATVQIEGGFPELDDPNLYGACQHLITCTNPPGQVFNSQGNMSKANWIHDYFSTNTKQKLGGAKWKLTAYNDISEFVSVGDRIAFAPVVTHGFIATNSSNITISNLQVRSAPAMAFAFNNVSGFIHIDNATIAPSDPSRILSSNADAFHIINSRAPVSITHSYIANTGDDVLNISSHGLPIIGSSSTQVVVNTVPTQPFYIGETVQFVDSSRKTRRLPGEGYTTITGVSVEGAQTRLTLASDISAVRAGDVLFNVSASSPYSSFSGNVIGSQRGAFRMRSYGGTVTSNQFMDPRFAKILYSVDSAWNEGFINTPIAIAGNSVSNGALALFELDWAVPVGPLNAGPFLSGPGIYFANSEGHYCYFESFAAFSAITGLTNINGMASVERIPNTMLNDGPCR